MAINLKSALASALILGAAQTQAQGLELEIELYSTILDSQACTKDGHLVMHFGEVSALAPAGTTNEARIFAQSDIQAKQLANDFAGYVANMTYAEDFAPADEEIANTGSFEMPPLLIRFLKHSGETAVDNIEAIYTENSTSFLDLSVSLGGFDWSEEPHPDCTTPNGPSS